MSLKGDSSKKRREFYEKFNQVHDVHNEYRRPIRSWQLQVLFLWTHKSSPWCPLPVSATNQKLTTSGIVSMNTQIKSMMSTTSIGDQSEVDNFRYCFYEHTNQVHDVHYQYRRPIRSWQLQVLFLWTHKSSPWCPLPVSATNQKLTTSGIVSLVSVFINVSCDSTLNMYRILYDTTNQVHDVNNEYWRPVRSWQLQVFFKCLCVISKFIHSASPSMETQIKLIMLT